MTSASTSSLTSSSLSSFTIGQEKPNTSNKKRKKASSSSGVLSLKGREIAVKKIPQLPNALVMEIFLYLERGEILLGARVSKEWYQVKNHQVVQKELLRRKGLFNSYAFGKPQWDAYFGDIGEEPPLPVNIEEILKLPCPIWKNKLVKDTHIFTLIPKTVEGKLLTLKTLGNLVKKPKQGGHATKYKSFSTGGGGNGNEKACVEKNIWVLMTRNILPNTRNQSYDHQMDLVKQLAKRTKASYDVPRLIEAAVSILTHYVRSGERLYTDNPETWTRCQENYFEKQWQMSVGKFGYSGINIASHYDSEHDGVGALRRFK